LDSITYRGTPEFPGLVLALDEEPGGFCEGVAFRVSAEIREETHAYLRARELITYSYLEKFLPLSIEIAGEDGVQAPGLCYVMDRSHVQYHGGLTLAEQAEVIATAVGPAGSNIEYLMNTVDQLHSLGVHDADMAHIADLVTARG
jgi:cation transport protein ChaC